MAMRHKKRNEGIAYAGERTHHTMRDPIRAVRDSLMRLSHNAACYYESIFYFGEAALYWLSASTCP